MLQFFKRLVFTKFLKFFIKRNYILQKYTEREKVVSFFKYIKPVTIKEGLIRIGSKNDGGYLIPNCLEDIKYNFSPGVSDNFEFETDLYSKHNIESFLADFSIEDRFHNYEYLSFEKKFIGIVNSNSHIKLEKWVNSKVKDTNNLILSMDIENNEWSVLLDTPLSTLSKFKILVIEFHNFAKYIVNKDSFMFVEDVFKKIKNSFEIVHIHPNNCCDTIKYQDLKIPNVVEITFLNKDSLNLTNEKLTYPHKLDSKNIFEKDDIILQKIWDL